MTTLRKVEELLLRLEGLLVVVLLSIMVLMSFSQVLLREVFHTGIIWGDTFLRQLVLWVGFLGAAIAAAQDKHFAWEAAQKSARWGPLMRLAAHVAAAAIAAMLVRASWIFLLEEKASGQALFSVGSLAVPAWAFEAAIPAGFILVTLHILARSAEAAAALRK